jgi:hypothetical protein
VTDEEKVTFKAWKRRATAVHEYNIRLRSRRSPTSGHWMAAEGIPFPRRWYGSMISANLEVSWEMSA